MCDKDLKIIQYKNDLEKYKIEAKRPASEVASLIIARYGLGCAVFLILIAIAASIFVPESKFALIIQLLSSVLTAVVAIIATITGLKKDEKKIDE